MSVLKALNIKQIRLQKNLTLRQLSSISGVSNGYISDLENGKEINPTMAILRKLANALGVSVAELLSESKATGVKDQPTSL